MFIEGVYLHARLVTNVFDKPAPFKLYYFVGWGNERVGAEKSLPGLV